MKGIVLYVLCLLAISLSEAYVRKKPKFDVFEIRENQRTKQLQVKPVKLQHDLESREKEKEYQTMINRLWKPIKKKRVNDLTGDILKRLKVLKEQEAAKARAKAKKKAPKGPIIMLVSPEYLDVLEDRSDHEVSFLDNTRSQDPKLGSNAVFHIVPPEPAKKTKKVDKLKAQLRSVLRGGLGDDRTDAPRLGHRIYYDDFNNGDD